jgi:hypothetical protein
MTDVRGGQAGSRGGKGGRGGVEEVEKLRRNGTHANSNFVLMDHQTAQRVNHKYDQGQLHYHHLSTHHWLAGIMG